MTAPTALYRHFGDDAELLYVGISATWPKRTREHATASGWFSRVCRVEIAWFPSRDEALAAEIQAIKTEKPKFNTLHSTRERKAPLVRRTRAELAAASAEFEKTQAEEQEQMGRIINKARCEIDLIRCRPTQFLEGLKPRSAAELYHLANELHERGLGKRARLIRAYADLALDSEVLPA